MPFKCDCKDWARVEGVDLFVPDSHHSRCPKYQTEKRPRLMYYEEAEDCWAPWPGRQAHGDYAESYLDNFEDGDDWEIRFRRIDMTDKEFAEIPDSDSPEAARPEDYAGPA